MDTSGREIKVGSTIFHVGDRLKMPSGRAAILIRRHYADGAFLEVRYEDEPAEVWALVNIHYKLVTVL